MLKTIIRSVSSLALVAAAALATAGCGDAAGPAGAGRAIIALSGDAPAASRVSDRLRLSAGDVPTDAVSSLTLDLTRIDVHVAGSDIDEPLEEGEEGEDPGEVGEAGWITLEVSLEAPIDLLDLAALGTVELAEGTVPAGKITQIRLFFDTLELTLDTDVDVANQTVAAGVYAVRVPSAEQTGLKINQVNTTVSDGETGTVTLEIGVDASIGSLVYNANGFQLSPVLRVK